MGHFGRIRSTADLPDETMLIEYVRKAAKLNQAGVKVPARRQSKEKKALIAPSDLKEALKRNAKAKKRFEGFSYTNKRNTSTGSRMPNVRKHANSD